MKEQNKFNGFESAGMPTMGLTMIFDIAGFTNFFNKPDVQLYITRYINEIIECVEATIYGGTSYWNTRQTTVKPLSRKPSLRKFLGDGILYIWELSEQSADERTRFKMALINRLWNLQTGFSRVNDKLYEHIPTADLPRAIKFGIAQGTIYKLAEKDDTEDFVGPCINLASRLVKYCSEINFICSARLDLTTSELEQSHYLKIIAKELRSFENEIVIIHKSDYERVNAADKARLFKEIKKPQPPDSSQQTSRSPRNR